jgi:cytochrome P450
MRTIISAGYETVSAIIAVYALLPFAGLRMFTHKSLQWMLYEIAINPDFQSKLREEICAIPEHLLGHLNFHLPLLDAALKETLRLHPAILENHHEVKSLIYVQKIIEIECSIGSGNHHHSAL